VAGVLPSDVLNLSHHYAVVYILYALIASTYFTFRPIRTALYAYCASVIHRRSIYKHTRIDAACSQEILMKKLMGQVLKLTNFVTHTAYIKQRSLKAIQ